MIVLTVKDAQKAVNRCASTVYDWIIKGRIPAPTYHRITGRALGWTMEQLTDENASWASFDRKLTDSSSCSNPKLWHREAMLKAAIKSPQQPTKKVTRTKLSSKANITHKHQRNGYRVNCTFNRPAYASELDKITEIIPATIDKMKKPLGIVVTVRGHHDIASTIKSLKDKLALEFGLPTSEIHHISNRETSKKHGEHAHVCLIMDVVNSLRTPKKRVLDIVDKMSDRIFIDPSRKSSRKGVHLINSARDIACYVYHASYLAKVKTAKNRKPSVRCSLNIKCSF